jgi:hypothetical protein
MIWEEACPAAGEWALIWIFKALVGVGNPGDLTIFGVVRLYRCKLCNLFEGAT